MNEVRISKTARKIMAIISLVYGFFVAIIGPILIEMTLQFLLGTIVPLIPSDPHLAMAPGFISTWFFALRSIDVVAGITLVLIAYYLWKGESWAWPVALSAISLPTIFGVLTTLPYIVHVGTPPPAMIILIFGLVTYLIVLLLKRCDKIEKLARAIVFTLLGVIAGQINVLIMHGIKGLYDNPDVPLLIDPKIAIYGFEAPLNLIALIMCILAIPLLANRRAKMKTIGWFLGLIAGISVIIANLPTHIIRMVTQDFLLAGILGIVLTISLLIPAFRSRLIKGED